nr:MAG: hypothetical protein [Bacteriophage sp.]
MVTPVMSDRQNADAPMTFTVSGMTGVLLVPL